MTKLISIAGLALALLSTPALAYDPLQPYCGQGQGCAAQVAVPTQQLLGGPWPKGATFHIVMDGKSFYTDDKGTVVAIGGAAGDRGFHGGGGSLGGVGQAIGGIVGRMSSPDGGMLNDIEGAINMGGALNGPGGTIEGGDGASGGIGVGGAMGGMGGQTANAGF